MNKILAVAAREFIATVATRGFLIGGLLLPLFFALVIFAMPRLYNPRDFRAVGQVAIMDHTGVVTAALKSVVDPHNLEQRRLANSRHLMQGSGGPVANGMGPVGGEPMAAAMPLPALEIIERPADADLAHERTWLVQAPEQTPRHLALAVINAQALAPSDKPAPAYDLYVPGNLDARTEQVVRDMLRDAIVSVRVHGSGLDLTQLDDLMRVDRGRAISVARDGSVRPSAGGLNFLIPFAMAAFMLVAVLGGGQFLLTTMVEEKSGRIIEVLLSAVSPLELLAGKILGQLCASMLAMALYLVLATAALIGFSLVGLIDPSLLFYLFVFFVISFLVIGSVMVAVGAAVNEMRDAQALLMPFMLLLAGVWIVVMPVSMNPNSRLAVTLSFTPVVNTFAMMLRLSSIAPPPLWQVWLSVAVGLVTVVGAIWFAAKVFKIALLLHGRPPNLGTLLRWAMSP
jgi:ABC-2 type transport system permease protein